jgi:DNA-binding PadR family transcriptional regulator
MQSAAEPARFALLGLLVEGSHHGYDLARLFAPGSALADIVHVSASHLYALLSRLERDGFIVGHREEVGAHPPRRVYELTDAGREAVLRWIDDPVEHPRDMRIDFPLKLYLVRKLNPAAAESLVTRQRGIFAAYVDRLKYEPTGDVAADEESFIELLREGRIGRLQAALDWLDRCVEMKIVPT